MLIDEGVAGDEFTVIVFAEAKLVPQELVAVTESVPLVAELLKETVMALPDPLTVAPVPE